MQLTGASLDYVNASKNVHDLIRSLFFCRQAFLFCSYFLLSFSFSVSAVYKNRDLSPAVNQNHNIHTTNKSFANVTNFKYFSRALIK
jgi:hypothetical protein